MQNLMNTSTLLVSCARQSPCCVQLQFVRWRKPRWIPQAKSKRFRVPVKIRPPMDEREERYTLNNRYGTIVKALWLHQNHLHYSKIAEQESETSHNIEEAELGKLLEENERINAQVRAIREKALEEEWLETEEYITRVRQEKEIEEENARKQTEEEILLQMERLKTAIKLEDLDDAIEKALSTEVDYNFAIDKQGNIYPGRHNSSVPENSPEDGSSNSSDDISRKIRLENSA